ncbi:MAG: export ABC transporter ATP-binding protein, partial [Tissierellia bacterium]|nr:export ABC transporter ATP-binding protein [Tissierellia bacterium]
LIMDEPTVGIDPQSRSHILDTVLKLSAQGMTIIYTTHYMEEAEELCTRICIMDEGEIIASGTKQELVELVNEKTQINIKLDNISDNMLQIFKGIPGVYDATILDDTVTLFGENGDILLAEIISKISEENSKIQSIDIQKPNLEAVFLHLTGKALRD